MSNETRVLLDEDVSEAVLRADEAQAFAVLSAAVEIQQREERQMTLEEALVIIGEVARKVEALG